MGEERPTWADLWETQSEEWCRELHTLLRQRMGRYLEELQEREGILLGKDEMPHLMRMLAEHIEVETTGVRRNPLKGSPGGFRCPKCQLYYSKEALFMEAAQLGPLTWSMRCLRCDEELFIQVPSDLVVIAGARPQKNFGALTWAGCLTE